MAQSNPVHPTGGHAAVASTPTRFGADASALVSRRLRVLPASRSEVHLLLEEPSAFLRALQLDQAPDWFDLGYDDWAHYILKDMKAEASEVGWWIWWLVERGEVHRLPDRLVGYVGFKGPPTPGGNVELTYGIAPSRRRQGLISEGVGLLMDWAFRSNRVRRIIATVDPENIASLGVLRRLGFRIREDESDEEQVVLGFARRP